LREPFLRAGTELIQVSVAGFDVANNKRTSTAAYRVGGEFIVRNIDAWYTAFKPQPGDKLYLSPDARGEFGSSEDRMTALWQGVFPPATTKMTENGQVDLESHGTWSQPASIRTAFTSMGQVFVC
jgi:hypothetical protein